MDRSRLFGRRSPKYLRFSNQGLRDGEDIPSHFIARNVIARYAQKARGTVHHKKKGVEGTSVVFGIAAKTLRELRKEPGASRTRLIWMKGVGPKAPEQLILVRF